MMLEKEIADMSRILSKAARAAAMAAAALSRAAYDPDEQWTRSLTYLRRCAGEARREAEAARVAARHAADLESICRKQTDVAWEEAMRADDQRMITLAECTAEFISRLEEATHKAAVCAEEAARAADLILRTMAI